MAEERLAFDRSRSMRRTRLETVICSASAIARTSLQNGSSRLTLVLCPPITTERLVTADFPISGIGPPGAQPELPARVETHQPPVCSDQIWGGLPLRPAPLFRESLTRRDEQPF